MIFVAPEAYTQNHFFEIEKFWMILSFAVAFPILEPARKCSRARAGVWNSVYLI